jgi:hypothetical protein
LPGGLICDAVGLKEDSESRQILPMYADLGCGRLPVRSAAGLFAF